MSYWSNQPFLFFSHSGALALSPERQSARRSKNKNGWLDQYGAGPFEQQQYRTAGIEGVKAFVLVLYFTHVLRKIVSALPGRRPSPHVSPAFVLLTTSCSFTIILTPVGET